MLKNKSWQLTPHLTLTLAPPNKRGECNKCHSEKEIWLISETDLEYRKLCWSCSLDNLRKLETGNYPVKDKEQIIKEIREALLTDPDKAEEKQVVYNEFS